MYEKLNITENHLRILSLFTKSFNKEYYIREIQRILKISPRTSQLILEDLEKKTVLESLTKGKIKLYKIKIGENSKQYLIFTEQYKTLIFLQKYDMIREIITKISPFIEGIGMVFGSYAKNIEKKHSDLDIFIIGVYNRKEIEKISKLYGLEINIKNYPLDIFEKNINEDILIKEVMDNHILFLNAEQFVKEVLKNG